MGKKYDITSIRLTKMEILERYLSGATVRLTLEGTIHSENVDLLRAIMAQDKGYIFLQGRLCAMGTYSSSKPKTIGEEKDGNT